MSVNEALLAHSYIRSFVLEMELTAGKLKAPDPFLSIGKKKSIKVSGKNGSKVRF